MHRASPAVLHRMVFVIALAAVMTGCSSGSESSTPPATTPAADSSSSMPLPIDPALAEPASTETPSAEPAASPVITTPRPAWLGQRTLPTDRDGLAVAATTPDELVGRAFATIDTIPAPTSQSFESSIEPLSGDPLARSSWNETCPVTVSELVYLTVSFWGFDGEPHTGELIVNTSVAHDLVGVFEILFSERYPIEEMRIVTDADIDAPPIGDTNNTGSFVCRVVQGTTVFSEHARGLAVDINPFHNPLVKGDLVLPELARYYTDRSIAEEALIQAGDPVVEAFASIGWSWGGSWTSLKDYQHFSHNGQ